MVEADPFALSAPGLAPGQIEMTTVSTRPSLVTGGQVRVLVRGLAQDDVLTVKRDRAGVTSAFHALRPGERDGLVGGLHPGLNRLVATVRGRRGARSVTLAVTDHPIQGPVISGPHQQPFICQTRESGLGPPTDQDCDAPVVVHWFAQDVSGNFLRLADPRAQYPAQTATTTAPNGRRVPFVVRVESAVINRSITRIAVLDDPRGTGASDPFVPSLWNHRLLYQFGESCGTGYHQGVNHETSVFGTTRLSTDDLGSPFVDLPGRLGQGYAVGLSTLTTLGVHCNDVLSAETLMMVKEHVVNEFGPITHTIGLGASGGAIQQYLIANNYPGLIDAATTLISFPDMVTTGMTAFDCSLLERAFARDPRRWSPAKQAAVSGLATAQVCKDWVDNFGNLVSPSAGCDASIPRQYVYDARTNPHGARCTVQDSGKNVWGVDPATGFARRPADNVGLQYGLRALQAGAITTEDFISLNRDAGGMDIDGHPIPQRSAMDPEVASIAYRTGRISGRGALAETPLIDLSVPMLDFLPAIDLHDQIRPFEARARMIAHAGAAPSHVIWSAFPYPATAVPVAEQWLNRLDELQAKDPALSRADAIAASRSSETADQCRFLTVGATGLCNNGVLRHSSIRQQAGGPLAEDNIKCQLKPIDRRDYPASTTNRQLDALGAIFSGGVCDWSRPSVGWSATSTTWLSFGGTTLARSPFAVPYPLVRSKVPSA